MLLLIFFIHTVKLRILCRQQKDQTYTMDDDDMMPGKSPEENEDHDDHNDDKDNDQSNQRVFSSGVRWRRLPWPGPSLSISCLIQIFIIFSTLIRPSLEGMEIVE